MVFRMRVNLMHPFIIFYKPGKPVICVVYRNIRIFECHTREYHAVFIRALQFDPVKLLQKIKAQILFVFLVICKEGSIG